VAERAEREAQEQAKEARLDEPLDAQPPHPQGVGSQEAFRGTGPDAGTDPPHHG
jgi:cell division protease FtsH